METEQTQIQVPTRKSRSDKGSSRKKSNAGGALSGVLAQIQDLNRDEVKRVLTAAALFCNIRLIEAPVEVSNGKRD
jgi:hypothetical protein